MDDRTMKHSFMWYQLPALLWALLIYVSSSIPSERIPDFSIFRFDKAIHFCLYFLFSLFTYRALRYQDRFPRVARHALSLTLLAIVAYGASDEIHQYFVPGRQADVHDLLADTLGACVLVAGVWWKEWTKAPPRSD